ncbi:MAG: AAA family ATPase [Chloroflexi bacterium]|nr:AAA family ATPase [Chloroflexota bacterium]
MNDNRNTSNLHSCASSDVSLVSEQGYTPIQAQEAQCIRDMLSGCLDSAKEPNWGQFNGHGYIIKQLYDVYKESGPRNVWSTMGYLVKVNPALSDFVLNPPPVLLPSDQAERHIFTATEYMERPPVAYLDSEKTIQKNGMTMIFGMPGSGKSLWALRKLAEIADSYPVMLVLAEGNSGTPERIRAEVMARNGRSLSEQFYVYDQGVNLTNLQAVQDFISEMKSKRINPQVIAFDTLAACMPGADENGSRDVSLVVDNLKLVGRECGTSVVVVHHSKKDRSGYRGHSILHGHFDVILEIVQTKGNVSVKGFKSKDSALPELRAYRLQPYVTRQDPVTGADVTGAALIPAQRVDQVIARCSGSTLNARHLEVLKLLRQHKADGCRHQEILEATQIPRSSLKGVMESLTETKLITQPEARGKYLITDDGIQALENQVQ